MPITAKQLAKELGLSEAAVSMALNNKSGVSTKTRRRVIKAAQEMGYDFSRIEGIAEHCFDVILSLGSCEGVSDGQAVLTVILDCSNELG